MRILRVVVVVVVVLALAAGGAWIWMNSASDSRLAQTFTAHSVDLPVPWPLTPEEIDALRAERLAAIDPATVDPAAPPVDPLAGVDLDAIAKERALERGRHLLAARYGCGECHGSNLGGGVMIDAPPIGRILGPNLTLGEGGVTAKYTTADWDRIVRHGIKPDGHPAVMPSVDFLGMSDQELSDIILTVREAAPVDNVVPPLSIGPVGTLLMATGQILLSAELMEHDRPHVALPPAAEVSVAFGQHLGQVCTGCHGPNLVGGPVVGGDPSWPPAANLTPHADGLEGWSYEQFVTALREARRPDGSAIRLPMAAMGPYAKAMTDLELRAMWTWLQQLAPMPDSA